MAEHPTIKLVRLFQDGASEFRFIAMAQNGRTIVESSEGYTDKDEAIGAIHGVFGDDMEIHDLTLNTQNDEGRDSMSEEQAQQGDEAQGDTPQGDEAAPQEGEETTPQGDAGNDEQA